MKLLHAVELPILLISLFKYITSVFDKRLSATIYLVGFQFVASLCASFLSPLAGYSYDTIGFADTYMILAAIVIFMTIISRPSAIRGCINRQSHDNIEKNGGTMNQKLQQAQFALEQLKAQRGNTYYPDFHLAPPAGWMNDPNGLIYFDGLYHAFYQHHPMSADWGPMHWGHATSHDMIHWQHQPIALAPGDDYDRDGCFSGCAVNDNGTLSLIYTGHVWLKDAGDDSAIREVQCLATSTDGIHFEKQGIVLTPPDGIMHFRDPKIWQENGTWWMVLGARDAANCGQTLIYKGNSLREWQLDRILAHADVDGGYMWECPDFFRCGNHHYLMFSPQGIQQSTGYQYRNRFQSGVIKVTGKREVRLYKVKNLLNWIMGTISTRHNHSRQRMGDVSLWLGWICGNLPCRPNKKAGQAA